LFIDKFKDKVCYHISDADLDGTGCTVLSKYYLTSICKTLYCFNTGQRDMTEVPQFVFDKEIDIILFTDIAPSLSFANELIKRNKIFVVVDHHLTSVELLEQCNISKENYFYTDKSCATLLLYNLFTEGIKRKDRVVQRFATLVNTYDFWLDNTEDWEEANYLNYLKKGVINWARYFDSPDYEKNSDFINLILEKFRSSKRFMFNFRENRIISTEKQKEDKNYKKAKDNMKIRVDGQGNKYLYLEAPSGLSVISNRILKESPDVQYAVCRSTFKTAIENRSISLRSREGFSVKDIAEKWGGGGHSAASGLSMTNEEQYKDLISGKINLI